MIDKIRKRVSSAHVLAAMALFVALGGSAYALKKNSVGTKQLKNSAVKTAKIADGAVTTPKLAADAVTGEKVVEGSLGKVPSAASADSATNAANATNAASADTADSAANASALAGNSPAQVRTQASGVSDTSSQGLDDSDFEQVMTVAVAIPAGGGDLVVNASAEIDNGNNIQAGSACELRSDGDVISARYNLTIPDGHNDSLTLTAHANNLPATPGGDPENVGLFCQGSIADDGVDFMEGDLTVQVVPSGV